MVDNVMQEQISIINKHYRIIAPEKIDHTYRDLNPELPSCWGQPVRVEDVVGGPVILPDGTCQDVVPEAPARQLDTDRGGEEDAHVVGTCIQWNSAL